MTPIVLEKKKEWANPDEVDKCLKRINEIAAEHGLNSITVVGELPNGQVWFNSSRTEDRYKVAGALMMTAMELMGFRAAE